MQPGKHKKLTYFLICAVTVVWGVILYRIFFNGSGDEYEMKVSSIKKQNEPYDQYIAKTDTFKLALNYRDPFLDDKDAAKIVQLSQPVASSVRLSIPQPPKVAVDWNMIKYGGYIVNPATKKIVSIVVFNGNERMLTEGQIFEGIKLLKNKKDSILVNWKGKEKYIRQ